VVAEARPAGEVVAGGVGEVVAEAGTSGAEVVVEAVSSGRETNALTNPPGPERERTLARASAWESEKASRSERRSEISRTVARGASRPRRSRVAQAEATV
jgi:hypothetical protein